MRILAFWLACTLISTLLVSTAGADDLGGAEPSGSDESHAAAAGDVDDDSEAQATESPEESGAQAIPLSLEEAIRLALENNLDVKVQRFGPLIGAERMREVRGAFDPELFADFGYSDVDSLRASSFYPTSSDRTIDGFGGFRGLIPMLGSEYDFRFEGSRTKTDSIVQSLSPEYRSSFSLDFTQPLLRDLIWNEPWTRVKTTRVLYDETLEEFRRQVMDTVQQVEDGYWNLIASKEQKAVAEKSLETAHALLDQTTTQYEVGVVSKVEVVEAEAGVANRDVFLIRTDNAYLSAQDQLVNLILGTGLTAESNILVEPTDKPEDYVFTEIDAGSATQRAFEHRPELAIIDDQLQRQLFEQKFANNQRLPSLDVRIGYGNRGLGGECSAANLTPAQLIQCQNAVESNWGGSLDNFLTDDAADHFSARAMFSIPIPNTAARSRASQAEIEIRRIHAQKRRLEQSIILEIRKAIRDVKSTHEGIEAARRASAASAEQLRAERIRLEYGESTPFEVLLREEDFVEDESLEIDALRLYRISITALSRAQGSILSNRNIAIDAVRTLR